MRGIRIAAERRANTVEFIGSDSSADPTTANEYSDLSGAILHRLTDLFGIVRIIVRNRPVVRTEVDQIVTRLAQLFHDPFIERITTMICSDRNTHKYFCHKEAQKAPLILRFFLCLFVANFEAAGHAPSRYQR